MDEFRKDLWSDAIQFHDELRGGGTALVRVEKECGFFVRDAQGRIVHRYHLPKQAAGWLPFGFMRLDYDSDGAGALLEFKGRHIHAVQQCLRKLAARRRRASVLEVGSTIGENYHVLRNWIRREALGLELAYYGFDIDEDLVAASHVLFGSDPNFFAAVGECEVLAGLPGRSVDVTTSLGVLNHAIDAPAAFGHALRIARVAFAGMIQVSETAEPLELRAAGGVGTDWTYTILTRRQLEEMMEEHGVTHRYCIAHSRFDRTTASHQGRYYMGHSDADLPVRLEWVVLAKTELFPEWEGVF